MAELKIVALAGGVGGAKLADGLAQVVQPERLTVIVNTADDFTYLGLKISPDLDTVCYTLAGMANPETGWGRKNETWNVLKALRQAGLPDWFKIGDADMATHLARTERLSQGWKLSRIVLEFCHKWGVHSCVLPMSDEVIRTWVYTNEGGLEFQEYFVHRKCEPVVRGFKFEGVERSRPTEGVLQAIEECAAVVICPSNPWVSIDPILMVPGIRKAVTSKMVIAVSPITGDKTYKGPAAKMFAELGVQPSALAVAEHYRGLIHSIFIDNSDKELTRAIHQLGINPTLSNIMMKDRADRGRLAKEIIDYIQNQ